MTFRFKSKIGKVIELTREKKNHVFEFHPDVKLHFQKISEVLENPDQIRNFILTCYLTDKIITGEKIYEKK